MNINLHTSEAFLEFRNGENLWFTASRGAVEVVVNKLAEFHPGLGRDIVACVTDGAGVMVKFWEVTHCHV